MQLQIINSLTRLFPAEGARVVPWHDAAREFTDDLSSLALEGALEAKIHIETRQGAGGTLEAVGGATGDYPKTGSGHKTNLLTCAAVSTRCSTTFVALS
jgi:hypothetical protein